MPTYGRKQPVDRDRMRNSPRKVSVAVCTSAQRFNVQALINTLQSWTIVEKPVRYIQLPYNDIDSYRFPPKDDIDVLILCHSINNRRFAITDVMDAIYDRFLPYAARTVGKQKLIVVVHDLPKAVLDNRADKEAKFLAFQKQQPTTFKNCSTAVICGRLEKKVDMGPDDLETMKTALVKAAQEPRGRISVDITLDSLVDRAQARGISPAVLKMVGLLVCVGALILFFAADKPLAIIVTAVGVVVVVVFVILFVSVQIEKRNRHVVTKY